MKLITGSVVLFFILIIIPIIVGQNGLKHVRLNTILGRICFSHIMGFVSLLAIWQLLVFPMAYLNISFRNISFIYGCVLIIVSFTSAIRLKKTRIIYCLRNYSFRIKKNNWISYLTLIAFFILLAIQLYYAIFYTRTYMAADGYAVFSTMALHDNVINGTGMYTGEVVARVGAEWIQRAMQTQLYFPAFLSLLSGIHPASICYTVMYGYILLLSYESYYLLSETLFKTNKCRVIFLYLIALLYTFGYHSHFSLSFRMLGPNSEGKAILAVVITPLIFWYMSQVFIQEYSPRLGFHFVIISICSISLTLGTFYTFAALFGAMVMFGLILQKEQKQVLYLLWGMAYPTFCAFLYLYNK